MALKTTKSGGRTLYLREGLICTKNSAGEEESYPAVEGYVTDVAFRVREWEGKKFDEVVVTIWDGNEQFRLSVRVSSGYGRQLLKKLANCDYNSPIEFCPTYRTTGDKKEAGMFVNQGGMSIKQKWSKESPGDCPEMKKVMVKGVPMWDDSEQIEYLRNYFLTEVRPKLYKANAPSSASTEIDSGEVTPADDEDGPVPF